MKNDMKNEQELKPLLVSEKQVKEMLCIGEGTIQRLVRCKDFPPPLNIGISRNLWRLADIEEWVKTRDVRRTWGR